MTKAAIFIGLLAIVTAIDGAKEKSPASITDLYDNYVLRDADKAVADKFIRENFAGEYMSRVMTISYHEYGCFTSFSERINIEKEGKEITGYIESSRGERKRCGLPPNKIQYFLTKFYNQCNVLVKREKPKGNVGGVLYETGTVRRLEMRGNMRVLELFVDNDNLYMDFKRSLFMNS